MRPLLIAVLLSVPAFADEVVSPTVDPKEIGRYQLTSVRSGTVATQVKLDSRTGATWSFCRKGAKGLWGWCKMGIKAPLTPGPVGRFRLVTAETGNASLLLDTVSGRTWTICDDPTPEKSFSWCPIEE